jgi:hypothetical protein
MTTTNTQLVADMIRQSMQQGETPFLTISSNSMAPLLKIGDQIGLEPVEPGQLQAGDIITRQQNDHFLTHRFWGFDEQGRLQTRGDRPFTFDMAADPIQLLGRVIVRRRAGQELALTVGAGHRLNRHLAWLGQMEWRLLARFGRPNRPRPLPVRFIRRLIYGWAILLSGIINLQA